MFNIQFEHHICTVHVNVPFTLDDVHEIITHLETKKARCLILDIAALHVISSTTMGLIVAISNSLKEIRIKLAVTTSDKDTLSVLKLGGLDRSFPVFSSVSEGLEHFKKTTSQ